MKQLIFSQKFLISILSASLALFLLPAQTASAADCSDVYTSLSSFVVDGVNQNKAAYLQVSNATDVPWEVLAAIHYRETNFSHTNPSNGQGIFQFVNKEGGPYPTGPVSDAEFARQLTFMANRLQNDYVLRNSPNPAAAPTRKMTKNETDTTLIRNMFYSYNGRATVYANQAAQYGFSPSSQPYDGSPYVMNRFDCARARMGIITQDYGSLSGQDTRYGAFTIYARLKGDAYWLGMQKPYLWQPVTQQLYKDAAMTQIVPSYNGSYSVAPGQKVYAKITGRNIGNTTWNQSTLRLGTVGPNDRLSPFADNSWIYAWRAAAMAESSVAPGGLGTFTFSMTAPARADTYSETFGTVAEGVTWINNSVANLSINVTSPSHAPAANNILLPEAVLNKGDSLFSPERHSLLRLSYDGNLELWTNQVKTWESGTSGSGAVKLVNQGGDGNLVLYTAAGAPVWASNTFNPGASSKVVLQADGNLVIYTNNVASWSSNTVTYDQTGTVNTNITSEQVIFPGQSLFTPDRFYELRLQADGNLVIYTPNRAIWATGTNGTVPDRLVQQGDGNLVLYDASSRAIWSSRTNGTGANKLFLQGDGNLVQYADNGPKWATNTRLMQ